MSGRLAGRERWRRGIDSPRARGTSPRDLGTNPRAVGTNRSAGTPADVRRVLVARDRAGAILRRVGLDDCPHDGRLVEVEVGRWRPCSCPPITAAVAERLVRRYSWVVDDHERAVERRLTDHPYVVEAIARAAGRT